MADQEQNQSIEQGRITHGLQANALVIRTLEFVQHELPLWRDREDRVEEEAEERLNAQLCKHLNSRARKVPLPVMFHHEEKQAENRRVDISAGLDEGGFVGTTYHSIDDPFIVLEGKRLPTPGGSSREKEYITGGDALTGGIQRFKLALHGARMPIVAMIGYVQKHNAHYWHRHLNACICDLAAVEETPQCKWNSLEALGELTFDDTKRVSRCISRHPRLPTAMSGTVEIWHLWLELLRKGEDKSPAAEGLQSQNSSSATRALILHSRPQ